MKFDWNTFTGKTINITMHENYGMVFDDKNDTPLYEIVFKTGKLTGVYDEGVLLETSRESQVVQIFVPYQSIKCAEIFNV